MPGGGGGPEGSRAEWGMGLWKPSFRASCSSRVQLTRLVLTEAHSSISGLPTNRRVLKTSLERPELADSAFSQPPQKFTQEALIFHTPLLAGRLNRKPAKQGWTATATQIEMDVHILSIYLFMFISYKRLRVQTGGTAFPTLKMNRMTLLRTSTDQSPGLDPRRATSVNRCTFQSETDHAFEGLGFNHHQNHGQQHEDQRKPGWPWTASEIEVPKEKAKQIG